MQHKINCVHRSALTVGFVLTAVSCHVMGPTIPERALEEASKPIVLPEVPELDEEEFAYEADLDDLIITELPEPSRIGGDEERSFQLRNVELANAIHMVAEAGNVNIYLDAALNRMVDASFPSITLNDALQVLLRQNGLRLVEDPPGIFWVETNDGSQRETAHFRVQSIDASSVFEDLATLISQDATIVVNDEQNLIVLDGTARDVDLVAGYLESADRLKRQVLLEVELVEVSLDDTFELGFSHLVTDADAGGPNVLSIAQNLITGSGEFSVTLDNSRIPLSTTLTALQQYAGVNVLSSPRILAVTKSPAKVEVISEVPYVQATVSTNVGGGAAGTSTAEEVEFKEVGLTLTVTPTIQEGGVVEVVIDQRFSNVTGLFLDIPVVDARNLSTVMTVEDGHTVVLGGLVQNAMTEDDSGVPILMDLPLIGRLFRSDSDKSTRRELLIFVTPRILTSTQGARLAKKYRNNYRESVRTMGLTSAEDI
ncbi:MAG: type II secretory pathway component GspD/PulD (secretin) [Planctomycetota bacterium]|jgi:type II secretory pathway component GspD/PulD (secretin)